jgi:DNA-binding PadR family transcriptional regulator
MKEPTLSETVFLLAILGLKDEAYGVAIRERVRGMTGRSLSYGTLYSSLDQLFRKGYTSKSVGRPTPERGGRGKIFYRVTPKGRHALESALNLQRKIWASANGVLGERNG